MEASLPLMRLAEPDAYGLVKRRPSQGPQCGHPEAWGVQGVKMGGR